MKILDFGLAKLTEIEEPDVFAVTQSVHVDAALRTEAGTIIGTVAYMSPEQADGHTVDARSDIFAFGAVLYEMITGKRAFSGDSKLSTLASVLHSEPVPLSQIGPAIPRDVERIISRCLRKDPQRRWQSMADVKVALEDVLDELESGKLGVAGGAAACPATAQASGILLWPAVIVVALLAGAYAGWRLLKPVQPTFERLTYRRGEIPSAKFSPDGQTVVFSAQWASEPTNIFSMRPGSREYRPLDLPEGRILAISSTGEMAILLGPTTNGTAGTLARVPLSGGAPREILENVNDADWSPDGSTLAVSRTVGGKNRIEYPIGTVRYENDGRPPELLRVSPKGDLIAFFEHDNDVGDYTVTVLDMNGKKRALSRGWQRSGRVGLVAERRRNLVRRRESGRRTGACAPCRSTGKERLVVETPASMMVDDITRDKQGAGHGGGYAAGNFRAALRAPNKSAIFPGSTPAASTIFPPTARPSCSWSCPTGRRAIPRFIFARPTARRPCGWAMATGPRCRRTENWWRAF